MPKEKAKPKDDKDRPFPDPPRRKEDAANINIYALLVGINKYEGEIATLDGCIKDVELIQDFLVDKYGARAKVRIIKDEAATYDGIITAFKEHLIDGAGTGNDTFWFHFSGHGSEQFTASQFSSPKDAEGNDLPSLAPNGKDQTLVCYNPEGTTSDIYLADKELATLISEIHTAPSIGQKKPHVLVTLDCCHSGTGTRDQIESGFKVRKFDLDEPSGAKRPLDSYYGWKENADEFIEHQSRLTIPTKQHLAIAACTNLELAGDRSSGGVFTSSFIHLLKDMGEESINYVDLFNRTRARVKSIRDLQTPQFEPYNNFNPYTATLEGWALGGPGKYEIINRGNEENPIWYVNAGAINGFPTDSIENTEEGSKEKIQVIILKAKGEEIVGTAHVVSIGLQDSRLELGHTWNTDRKGNPKPTEETLTLNNHTDYVAEVFTLPAPSEFVLLKGNNTAIQALQENWNEKTGPKSHQLSNFNIEPILASESLKKPGLEMVAGQLETPDGQFINTYAITNLLSNKHLLDIGANDEDPVEKAKNCAYAFARWNRFLELKNPKSKIKAAYQLKLHTVNRPDWVSKGKPFPDENPEAFRAAMTTQLVEGNEIFINGSEDQFLTIADLNQPGKKIPFQFQVEVDPLKENEKLFFYFFQLKENYAIEGPDKENRPSIESSSQREIVNITNVSTFNLDDNETQAYYWFKLIVTRKEIDPEKLIQTGIDEGDRFGIGEGFVNPNKTEDWHSITFKVNILPFEGGAPPLVRGAEDTTSKDNDEDLIKDLKDRVLVFEREKTDQILPTTQMILTRLSSISDGNFIRRRVFKDEELVFVQTNEFIQPTLDLLDRARLIHTFFDENTSKHYIELTHEMLFEVWIELSIWLRTFGATNFALRSALHQSISRFRENTSDASNLWDKQEELLILIQQMMDENGALLSEAVDHPMHSSIQNIGGQLAPKDQTLFQELAAQWLNPEISISLENFIITGGSNQLLAVLLDDGKHWLNEIEVDFIKASWAAKVEDTETIKEESTNNAKALKEETARANRAEAQLLALTARSLSPEDAITAIKLIQLAKGKVSGGQMPASVARSMAEIFYQEDLANNLPLKVFKFENVASAIFAPETENILIQAVGQPSPFWSKQRQLMVNGQLTIQSDGPIAVAPDHSKFLTTASDFTVQLKNELGEILIDLGTHDAEVHFVAFSSDGEVMLSGSADGMIKLWNHDGNLINDVIAHEEAVSTAIFAPDGQSILTASMDKTAKLLDLNGNTISTFTGHQDGILAAHFSPHGHLIITVSLDNTIKIWSKEGAIIGNITTDASVLECMISPNGQYILAALQNNNIHIWGITTELLATFDRHDSVIRSLGFSSNGQYILSVDETNIAYLWPSLDRINNYLKNEAPLPEISEALQKALWLEGIELGS